MPLEGIYDPTWEAIPIVRALLLEAALIYDHLSGLRKLFQTA